MIKFNEFFNVWSFISLTEIPTIKDAIFFLFDSFDGYFRNSIFGSVFDKKWSRNCREWDVSIVVTWVGLRCSSTVAVFLYNIMVVTQLSYVLRLFTKLINMYCKIDSTFAS